jgi:hypothetical protein
MPDTPGLPEWTKQIDWNVVYKQVLTAAYRMSADRPNRKEYDYFVYVLGIMRSIRSDAERSPLATRFVSDDRKIVTFPDRPTQEDALSDAQTLRYIERRSIEAHRVAVLLHQIGNPNSNISRADKHFSRCHRLFTPHRLSGSGQCSLARLRAERAPNAATR